MMSSSALAQHFYFDSFEVDIPGNRIHFSYSTDAGHHFTHELTFAFPPGARADALASAAFALGMAELAHYWKAFLSPEIVIRAGALSKAQIAFWEKLYTKGLGEFFYVNKIDFRDLFKIVSDENAPEISLCSLVPQEGVTALVPFGGGKDSLVTGELLKKQGKSFVWFELEPLPFAASLRAASGVTEVISIGRNVQTNFAPIMELVAQGAPNGHVPITASYIFSAVFAATAHGIPDVVLSLEQSANEGNIEYLGEIINHQYSKTFEFEKAASDYISEQVNSSLRMFSLLRPLLEIQIVEEFTNYPVYFPLFISCNRGLKNGTWCGICAKCAFMFAALSAFLPPQTVTSIFKKNLFEDEALLPVYRELIGEGGAKPFDCVGTLSENRLALYLSGLEYVAAGIPLPFILQSLPIQNGQELLPLLEKHSPEHNIPAEYNAL